MRVKEAEAAAAVCKPPRWYPWMCVLLCYIFDGWVRGCDDGHPSGATVCVLGNSEPNISHDCLCEPLIRRGGAAESENPALLSGMFDMGPVGCRGRRARVWGRGARNKTRSQFIYIICNIPSFFEKIAPQTHSSSHSLRVW